MTTIVNKTSSKKINGVNNLLQYDSFQTTATVFLLQDKTWIEQGNGNVRFVFDLIKYVLHMIISPGTNQAYECRLQPRIRSKGPKSYVVKTYNKNTSENEKIFAVRFEKDEDSTHFRQFVENRDVPNNAKLDPRMNTSHDYNLSKNDNNNTTNHNITPSQAMQHSKNNKSLTSMAIKESSNLPTETQQINSNNKHSNMFVSSSSHQQSLARNDSNTNNHQKQNEKYNNNEMIWICSHCKNINDNTNTCRFCKKLKITNDNHNHNIPISNNQIQSSKYYTSSNSQLQQNVNQNVDNNSYNKTDQIQKLILSQHSTKLTIPNLEIHNKMFPPKKRDIKDIIWEQLEYIRHQNGNNDNMYFSANHTTTTTIIQ